MCEGDDYWTDPLKLQKQVDFLEANLDYAICFHQTIAKKEDATEYLMLNLAEDKTFQIPDIISRNFIPTVSAVFRVYEFFKKKDPKSANLSAGDWLLHIRNAEHGKIYFLKDKMAVYRIHSNGLWSSMDRAKMVNKTLTLADELNEYFDFKYNDGFERGKQNLLEEYRKELARSQPESISFLDKLRGRIRSILKV